MRFEIPVIGSVAITSNCTDFVGPEVVVKSPVFDAILTLSIDRGLVLQVTESVMTTCPPLAVPIAINCSLLPKVMLVTLSWLLT